MCAYIHMCFVYIYLYISIHMPTPTELMTFLTAPAKIFVDIHILLKFIKKGTVPIITIMV